MEEKKRRFQINKKEVIRQSILFVVISAAAIALSIGVDKLNFRSENIFLVYVVASLLLIVETGNFALSIAADVLFILSFNFFFTTPIYSFAMDDPNYYISFLFFFLVSFISGTVTRKLQKETKLSKNNETKIKNLYDLTTELLNCHDDADTFQIVCGHLKNSLNRNVSFISVKEKKYGNSDIDFKKYQKELSFSLSRGLQVGYKENMFSTIPYEIFPVKNEGQDYGVIVIDIKDDTPLTDEETKFVDNTLAHLLVIMEREVAIRRQESTKVLMEKEKLKNQLLRGLSHDLKTPLTSIQGGSNLLLGNYDQLTDEEKKDVIKDIYNESVDLYTFVENLLKMTKYDNANPLVNKKKEVVDDIIGETNEKVSLIKTDKKIIYEKQDDILMVNTQRELLIQVLYNLIDNAIKHTKENTTIRVRYYHQDSKVYFEVMDDGGGIDPAIKDQIFMDFYSLIQKSDHHRDTGLGLSICKSIVEAHGGKIEGINNDIGGATFRFYIPD